MMTRLAASFRNASLHKKLAASLFLLLIVPLLGVALFINSIVSGTLTTRIGDNDLEILKQTRAAVTTMVRDTKQLSLSVLSDEEIQKLILEYRSGNEAEYQKQKIAMTYLFQNTLYEKPWMASISLSDGAAIILQAGQYLAAEPTTWHARALSLKGVPVWTKIHELPDTLKPQQHRKLLSLVRSVNDLYRIRPIATLRISLDEAALAEAYRSAITVNGGQMFVVDGQGEIVSSPDKSLLGTSATVLPWFSTVGSQTEGWAKTRSGPSSAVFQYWVEDTDWRVVQVIPEANLNGQTATLNLVILASMIFCLGFGLFFTYLQERTVLAPISRISREMERLKDGDFGVSLAIVNRDEIGRLSQDFLDMARRMKELVDTVYLVRLKEKEAALLNLESQINPHFLYNTLDAIRWMAVRRGELEISEQIEALSALFRHALNLGQELTTVGAEVDHLENYLLIQKNRFGERIQFHLEVGAELRQCRTVKLVLQPLVENAIQHGLEPKTGPGTVTVTARAVDDAVVLEVVDDGVGTDETRIRDLLQAGVDSPNVFALKNIQDRIALRFGPGYGLDFRSVLGAGTRVTVTLPGLTLPAEAS